MTCFPEGKRPPEEAAGRDAIRRPRDHDDWSFQAGATSIVTTHLVAAARFGNGRHPGTLAGLVRALYGRLTGDIGQAAARQLKAIPDGRVIVNGRGCARVLLDCGRGRSGRVARPAAGARPTLAAGSARCPRWARASRCGYPRIQPGLPPRTAPRTGIFPGQNDARQSIRPITHGNAGLV